MKKSNKLAVSILSIIVAAVLFSIPVSMITEKITEASTSQAIIDNSERNINDEGNSYVFAVIEDEPVALSASPFHNSAKQTVLYVVAISLVSLLGISYVSWYSMVRRNIYNYSNVLPDYEIRSLIPAKPFLHPVELSAAEYEVQYRAARKYV